MFGTISKKVTACHERAGVCRRNAEQQSVDAARTAFLRIAGSWLNLARRFEHDEHKARGSDITHATGPLVFRCPATGREVNTGIETSYESLAGSWARMVQLQCEHCGDGHPVQDGYIRIASSGPD